MSLGDNQTGRLVPQKMKMVTIPSQIPYQMMMYSSVLRQKNALLDQRADHPEPTPECEGNLEKKYSSTDVSDGYKEKA